VCLHITFFFPHLSAACLQYLFDVKCCQQRLQKTSMREWAAATAAASLSKLFKSSPNTLLRINRAALFSNGIIKWIVRIKISSRSRALFCISLCHVPSSISIFHVLFSKLNYIETIVRPPNTLRNILLIFKSLTFFLFSLLLLLSRDRVSEMKSAPLIDGDCHDKSCINFFFLFLAPSSFLYHL
jgi:hypothetical protein